MPFSFAGKRVFVAGHKGMVGSAIVRRLEIEDCEVIALDRATVDLRDQRAVFDAFADIRPQAVIVAAAKVGGILANSSYPADFLYDNLVIETNVVEAARRTDVEKLLMLGSSCIYPKLAEQPLREEALLTGPLEPTNQWYAIAKIAGIMLARAYRLQHGCDFISAMPTNLYGPNDNFDLRSSHVLPALLRKAHEAKIRGADSIEVWGTGKARREFLHVDDLADACIFLMKSYSGLEHINVGVGKDISIGELTTLICDVVGFRGRIAHDFTKPDGTPQKLLSVDRLSGLGWEAGISLREGLSSVYDWFLAHSATD